MPIEATQLFLLLGLISGKGCKSVFWGARTFLCFDLVCIDIRKNIFYCRLKIDVPYCIYVTLQQEKHFSADSGFSFPVEFSYAGVSHPYQMQMCCSPWDVIVTAIVVKT